MTSSLKFSFVDNGQSHLMLNPRLPGKESEQFQKWFSDFSGPRDHYWIQSSGSSAAANESTKLIALSKRAFRSAAAAANRFLGATEDDVWGLNLPDFHVGGLSIWARSELTGGRVADLRKATTLPFREQIPNFLSDLRDQSVSLLSLVPTQVYDLVEQRVNPPSSLRAVVVGGAALESSLYRRARELGWPLLPSFGMTEVCSQIATAPLSSLQSDPEVYPQLQVLDHLRVQSDGNGFLILDGDSLFTGVCRFVEGSAQYRMRQGPYVSHDRVELSFLPEKKVFLKPLGRATEFVKINGEGVNLLALREKFAAHCPEMSSQLVILDVPDERRGARIIAVTEAQDLRPLQLALESWNLQAFPPERILELRHLKYIPRTELGKVAWTQLKALI